MAEGYLYIDYYKIEWGREYWGHQKIIYIERESSGDTMYLCIDERE
jgi:hypothetical protein